MRPLYQGSHLIFFVLMTVFLIIGQNPAIAQEGDGHNCHIVERTSNLVTLDCSPGYATGHDRVLIYGEINGELGGVDGKVTDLPDIKSGALVFDSGADGMPNIVVLFSEERGGALRADIYDDRDGDGIVSIDVVDDATIAVFEIGPVVQVVAEDGWWREDQITNFNLDIIVDGPIRANFGYYDTLRTSDSPDLQLDGEPEVFVHIRDSDGDGHPDIEWRQVFYPIPETDNYIKTEVVVNTEDDEVFISDSLFWPYLGDSISDLSFYTKRSYFKSDPPINIDWSSRRITHVGEFIGSRTDPGNYFIYSVHRLEEGTLSRPNWESPFSYYDLSDQDQAIPNLMIRGVYIPPQDEHFWWSRNNEAVNDVLYVWRYPSEEPEQFPTWDFKIALIGRHEYDSIVDIGDLSMLLVPYATMPFWVTEQEWDFGAFVANEGVKAPNSEGIHEWGSIMGWLAPESFEYVAGWTDELNFEPYEQILEDYRGEIVPMLEQAPRIYISAVDHKLHMRKATNGIWNLGDDGELLYRDLDGDGYFDNWQHMIEDEVRSHFYMIAGYMIYADDSQVIVKRSGSNPALFESVPPRVHEEWLTIKQQLEIYKVESPAHDLMAIITRTAGSSLRLDGVTLSDFRVTDEGFRFVLKITSENTRDSKNTITEPDLLGITSLSPGYYVVEYDGYFHVKQLNQSRLSIEISLPAKSALVIGEMLPLQVVVANTGLADANDLTLVSERITQQKIEREVVRRSLSINGGQSVEIMLPWQHEVDGYTVRLSLMDENEVVLANIEQSFSSPNQDSPPETTRFLLSIGRGWWLVSAFILVIISIMVVLTLHTYTIHSRN